PAPVLESADALAEELGETSFDDAPVRVHVDSRDHKPAEKRWEWIRKGVPVVVELGARDIDSGVITITRRDDAELNREQHPRESAAGLAEALAEIQATYMQQARERLEARTTTAVTSLEQFRDWFSGEGTADGGFVRAPWSEDPATLKTMGELGVSVRCIPFDADLTGGATCVLTGGPAKVEAIFAKAY
ncbi:MAG TPA: His/Gly/Thr/Pro-type tRNA ligase C-terminal domain-containing protein, partial [Actinomycetota bacterium]|nr:His/Gly/Thr/Pro-type tRNA ligase C-terminal domain-containing protein [Actinomycetota bacterium]